MKIGRGVIVLGAVIIIVVGYLFYLWVTTIHDAVTTGEAYGYVIGDTKDVTYQKAKSLYSTKELFIRYPINNQGYGPLYKFDYSDSEYQKIKDRDVWQFYFDKMDFIRLSFENDILVRIYRNRQYFELP